jgi:hypothetical protein
MKLAWKYVCRYVRRHFCITWLVSYRLTLE